MKRESKDSETAKTFKPNSSQRRRTNKEEERDEDLSRKRRKRKKNSGPIRSESDEEEDPKREQNPENKRETLQLTEELQPTAREQTRERSSSVATMRPKSRLCFLVLVISSVSRGLSQTAIAPLLTEENEGTLIPSQLPNETKDEANTTTVSISSNQSLASVTSFSTVPTTVAATPSPDEEHSANKTTAEGSTLPVSTSMMMVSTTKGLNPPIAEPTDDSEQYDDASSSWGYVLLVIIILAIIALCVILLFLRRASRTYSFDLQRPSPVDHLTLPIGTFEPVYLDDLERPTSKENTTTDEAPPTANGTSQEEEKPSNGQNGAAAQEHPDANGLETSPTSNTTNTSNTGVSMDDEPVEPLNTEPSLMFSDAGEQQNENNNNPSVCSSEPFVEINLDGPAWCDQLLSNPEAPSSVLPFSPFSFSSSS